MKNVTNNTKQKLNNRNETKLSWCLTEIQKPQENPPFTDIRGILKKIKGHCELYTEVSMTVGYNIMHAKLYIMPSDQNYVHWKDAFIFFRVTTQNRSWDCQSSYAICSFSIPQ